MIQLNHLTIAGNLTRDPQVRVLASGNSVANFGIANSRRFKSGDDHREETVFLDCEAWGRTAELLGQYFTKGKPIIVEGRLKQDTWEDRQTGQKRHKILLAVDRVHFVPDGRRSTNQDSADHPDVLAPATAPTPTAGDDEPPF